MTSTSPFDGAPGGEKIYLPARTAGLTFAVAAESALAVFRLDNLTRAPGAPAHIMGIANTRHGVISVACLARWLNAGAPATSLGSPALLVSHGGECVALAVEAIDDAIVAQQEDRAAAPPGAARPLSAPISGVIRLGFSAIPVLDLKRLFEQPVSPTPSKE